MSTYVLNCVNDGTIKGTYANLGDAQTEASGLQAAYVATDPTNLSAQNTATLYVAVKTKSNPRNNNGITLTTNVQTIDSSWEIVTLSAS